MASKENKPSRKQLLTALSSLSRTRASTHQLWTFLMDASDSLLLEEGSKPMGALTAYRIQKDKIRHIPDAAFALMVSTALDQALELAILSHFAHVTSEEARTMFDDASNGPLSTFSARIKAAYALGIYPKGARDELNLLRLIRNVFAHSWEQISFATPAIAAGCNDLHIPNQPAIRPENRAHTPKERFLLSARILYAYLEWNSLGQGKGPMLFQTHSGRRTLEGL
jgi:DNA-binding MltR family transcriptional regulator